LIAIPVPLETDFFARLRLQDAAFSAGLPGMLAQLAALHAPGLPTPASSSALQHQLHTLSGCAATFGYRRLGREARALEQRLRVMQAFEAVPEVDWREWFTQLSAMIAWASVDPHRGSATAAPQLL
jgi:HPt (histidine-containing phosphotransfer) domain-containing protein